MRPASASATSPRLIAAAILLTIACSETTTPPNPTKLVFTVQPTTTTAGNPIIPVVAVAIQDEVGNTVTSSTSNITLATGSNTPGMTLSGTSTVAAVNGVATFPGITISVSSNYTLSATSPNLASATSVQFAVVTGPAAKLDFTVQPVTTLANLTIPAVTVAVQDAAGNTVVTANSTIAMVIGSNPGGGSLSGNLMVPALNGLAVFSTLSITKPGAGYTLRATTGSSITPATSNGFNVTLGPATQLVFTGQPSTNRPGATISPAVEVAIEDVAGNVLPTATNSITVTIGNNAGGGTLSGTTTVAAVSGAARFSDLRINNEGDGYTLAATSPNLSVATSSAFSIRNSLAFVTVSAGYFHTCGLVAGGAAYCWGDNSSGQLGAPAFSSSTAPAPVTGALTFGSVGTGRTHTCGVTTGGAAYCWGSNDRDQLGSAGGPSQSGLPVVVSGGLTFASATAGYAHSCGVTTSGAGYCWGDNSAGALGNGGEIDSNVPTSVSGGRTFATVSPGRYFTCGLTTGGAGYCWGEGVSGQIGDGPLGNRNVPAAVSGQLSFSTLIAGGFHTCGLTNSGLAYCWGLNQYGELGNGTSINTTIPGPVSGGLTFTMLTVGNRHNCGLTAAGVAYCWGDNSNGALGNGNTTGGLTPVAVAGGLTFTSISAGRFHTCGLATGSVLYCWGYNTSGQLGDGTRVTRLVPVPVR
jgi:alpha-tubulin suppressor-like RCC1 family protein